MLMAASEYLTVETVNDIRQSECYAIMVDESTDVCVNKLLVIYVKYISQSNTVCTRFLCNVEVKDGTADTIHSVLVATLDHYRIPLERMTAFASDGASVMTGCNNGVGVKLKESNPYLFSIHCIAHRLQLASIDSVNEDKSFQHFECTLRLLNSYFGKSTLRMHALEEMQRECGDPLLKPVRISDTRWLSTHAAVSRVQEIFTSLLLLFLRDDPIGIYKQIANIQFITKLHFYCDILSHLNVLITLFQRQDILPHEVDQYVASTVNAIRSEYLEGDVPEMGIYSQQLTYKLKAVMLADPSTDINHVYRYIVATGVSSHPIKFKCADINVFKNLIRRVATSVIDHLHARFPPQPIFEAFKVFDPKHMRDHRVNFASYGRSELTAVCTHFCNISFLNISPQVAQIEWNTIKNLIKDNVGKYSTISDLLQFPDLKVTYPNMYKVLSVIVCMPVTSVDCERGFSKMSLIKSDIRNKLNSETLNALMNVSISDVNRDKVRWGGVSEIFHHRLTHRAATVYQQRLEKNKRARSPSPSAHHHHDDMDQSNVEEVKEEKVAPTTAKKHKQNPLSSPTTTIHIENNGNIFHMVNSKQPIVNINQPSQTGPGARVSEPVSQHESDVHVSTFVDRMITENNLQSGKTVPPHVRAAIVNSMINNQPPIKLNEQDLIKRIQNKLKQQK
jgi:hypothetical protein